MVDINNFRDTRGPVAGKDNAPSEVKSLQYPDYLFTEGTQYAIGFEIIRRGSLINLYNTSDASDSGSARDSILGGIQDSWTNVKNNKGKRPVSSIQKRIYLYMPHGVSVSYNTTYDTAANPISRALAGGEAKTSIGDLVTSYGAEALAAAKQSMGGSAISWLPGIDKDAATQALMKMGNIAVNPHQEQFFTGVEFRTFSYEFKFTPRSENETKSTVEIIKAFKKHSLPRLEKNYLQRFWLYPDEFNITYLNLNKSAENPYLHKIDSCVCTAVSVNYTASGIWAAFRNGAPVEIDMSLNFVETTLMHQDKIESGGY